MNHLEGVVESLSSEISTNWTTQEQILPISIENFEFDPKLLTAPQNMKDVLTQYKYRKEITEKQNQKEVKESKIGSKLGSFLDNFYGRHASFHSSIDYNSCYFNGDVYGVQTIKIKGFSNKYSITAYKSSRSSQFTIQVLYM